MAGQVFVDYDNDDKDVDDDEDFKGYLSLAFASQVDVAPFHLLPDDPRVDQEQTTCHLEEVDLSQL